MQAKQKPSHGGWVRGKAEIKSGRNFVHIRRLRTLLALDDLEFDIIAFGKTLVALAGDAGIMNEYIRTVIATDEAVSLGVIEPFDFTFNSSHVPFLSCTAPPTRGGAGGSLAQGS